MGSPEEQRGATLRTQWDPRGPSAAVPTPPAPTAPFLLQPHSLGAPLVRGAVCHGAKADVGGLLPHTCALGPPHPLTPPVWGSAEASSFLGPFCGSGRPFRRRAKPGAAPMGSPAWRTLQRQRWGPVLVPCAPLCPVPPRYLLSSPCPAVSPHPAPGAAGGALRADYSSRHAPGSLCLRSRTSRTPRPSAVPRGSPPSGAGESWWGGEGAREGG